MSKLNAEATNTRGVVSLTAVMMRDTVSREALRVVEKTSNLVTRVEERR